MNWVDRLKQFLIDNKHRTLTEADFWFVTDRTHMENEGLTQLYKDILMKGTKDDGKPN